MKKIRIGNDIVIKWRITVNGEEVNLEGLDLSLYISTTYQPRKAIAFTVAGNEITATYKGAEQKVTGVYRLTLYRNEGENAQSILDACDAFELVSCSCLTVDAAFGGAEVELPVADLGVGMPGLSAYEIAVAEGFAGTQEEWLASLSAASEAAAAECREVIAEFSQAEDSRVTAEAQRVANENNRIAGEGSRVEAENDRAAAEQLRATAESKRDTAELARIANENNRADAEGARSSAEGIRMENEKTRLADEETRVQSEAARVTAETKRANAEAQRETSEADRRSAEQVRIGNETARQTAEQDRMTAEANRVTAENLRKTAEDARIANESTRQTNEQARVAAETNRESAETDRAEAEAQRADAEAARAEEFATFANTLAAKEDKANKVTSINADADDVHYPSAKAVREMVKPLWAAIEDKYWYGIEKDITVSTPACTRIGNMEFHRTLPVQSQMRGCLLADDGTVNKYLDPDDWTNEVRDGSQGQVMVEIPRHFRKCETDGNIIRVKLSLLPLDGFIEIPKMYVSAYEAVLERSTNKLCSVVNDGTDYRGGNNQSSWDSTYKSQLGMPATYINRTNFRQYARNRNTTTAEWNCYTYDVHVTLWWLFVTEYATIDSQRPYNEQLTADGYRQGGLGKGLVTLSSAKWDAYNTIYPIAKCGYTDNVGNKTTEAMLHIENDDASISFNTFVNRYRGIEHPFGHTWKIVDGVTAFVSPTEADGGDDTNKVYVASDPRLFNDTDVDGYRFAGLEARNEGHITAIQFGEFGDIVPTVGGGSDSTYYCDYHYPAKATTETKKTMWVVGGTGYFDYWAGFLFVDSRNTPTKSSSVLGTRLCFIPQNK